MAKKLLCFHFFDQYSTGNFRNTFHRNCRYSATTTELVNFPFSLRIIPMFSFSVAEHLDIKISFSLLIVSFSWKITGANQDKFYFIFSQNSSIFYFYWKYFFCFRRYSIFIFLK